jgi:hypothetical protein
MPKTAVDLVTKRFHCGTVHLEYAPFDFALMEPYSLRQFSASRDCLSLF